MTTSEDRTEGWDGLVPGGPAPGTGTVYVCSDKTKDRWHGRWQDDFGHEVIGPEGTREQAQTWAHAQGAQNVVVVDPEAGGFPPMLFPEHEV